MLALAVGMRRAGASTIPIIAAVALMSARAEAVDVPVGDKTLSVDVSNTTEGGYHFHNRQIDLNPIDPNSPTLVPSQRILQSYGEWFNRLQVRAFYGKFSLGARLDSAMFFGTLTPEGVQRLIQTELGPYGHGSDLALENRFLEELHSRFGQNLGNGTRGLLYPAKLWLGFKNEWIDATLGDFYLQLGRGLTFSVRKIDELGVDTTVRGGKVRVAKTIHGWRLEATAFGGQLNPVRIDYPTGRILNGSGSPLFFGFPRAAATVEFQPNPSFDPKKPASEFTELRKLARPSYLEDSVVGGNVTFGPRQVELGVNAVALVRQSNSYALESCKLQPGADPDACAAAFPTFSQVDAARLHDLIRNFSGSVRVPSIGGVVDGYVEVAGQQQTEGRVRSIGPNGTLREPDLHGYAIYANVNVHAGPIAATLEGKHYRSFYPLGANIDLGGPPFSAPEFGVISYSVAPRAESIYTEPIGSPDVCISGGRAKLDYSLAPEKKVYAWVGRSSSWTEIDPTNSTCAPAPELRTDTWDSAAGLELTTQQGASHYWGWIGARFTDRAVPAVTNAELPTPSSVFYREGYVRYDLGQKLTGPFSLSMLGYWRYRFEPTLEPKPWVEGENLLALNFNPSWSFIFGNEALTRPGFPTLYFNGSIVYRRKSQDKWYDKVFESARLFVGQRRAALRCVGGVCRVFPAFEGARIEIVSRF